MRKLIFTVVCLLLLTVQSQAVELPEDLMDAAPEEAEDLLDGPVSYTHLTLPTN